MDNAKRAQLTYEILQRRKAKKKAEEKRNERYIYDTVDRIKGMKRQGKW